MFEKLSELC